MRCNALNGYKVRLEGAGDVYEVQKYEGGRKAAESDRGMKTRGAAVQNAII